MTVIHQPDGVHVAGRNNDFDKTDEVAYNNKYWSTAKKYNLPSILEKYHEEHPDEYLAVQGELVGPGIQGNKMNLSELKFYIFNLFKSTNNCASWDKLGYEDLITFCTKKIRRCRNRFLGRRKLVPAGRIARQLFCEANLTNDVINNKIMIRRACYHKGITVKIKKNCVRQIVNISYIRHSFTRSS